MSKTILCTGNLALGENGNHQSNPVLSEPLLLTYMHFKWLDSFSKIFYVKLFMYMHGMLVNGFAPPLRQH